jgi:glucose/arabinose dehydrogenase
MRFRFRTTLAAVAALSAFALIGAACGDDEPDPVSSPESPGGEPTEQPALEGDDVRLTPVAEVESPVAMAARPGSDDLYVAEQTGEVRRIAVSVDGDERSYDLVDDPALDLTAETRGRGEQGLLGLAFSPDGSLLYVDYTDRSGDTRIVEYTMDGDRADASSARELLRIDQPYSNHNGGQLAFGPDGYLYIGMGDGGSSDDPERRSQDTNELLGKVLRIDPTPSDAGPYTIPNDNPFVDGGGAPEIWILGARNPWRFSFDAATDDLWVADVGQNAIEEVNLLAADPAGAGRGVNLGWPLREGSRDHLDEPIDGLTDPIYEYEHDGATCSVTGGYVYRGSAIPGLVGTYVYGDYCASQLRGLRVDAGAVVDERGLDVSVAENTLSSFGQDLEGELFVLSTAGTVYKIEPA